MSGVWYERVQGATSNLATANREPWESDDLELVIAFTDDVTDEEIAITLGRTLKAIQDIQYRIRREGVDPVRRAYANRRTVAVAVGYDYVTTFPPGDRD